MASSEEDWGGGGPDLEEEMFEEDWGGGDVEMLADHVSPADEPLPIVAVDTQVQQLGKKKTAAEILAHARACKAAKKRRVQSTEEPKPLPSPPPASKLALTLCRTKASSLQALLKSQVALAQELEISKSRIRDHLWAYSNCMLHSWKCRVDDLVWHCLGQGSGRREDDEGAGQPMPQPALFVRQRKFDETSSVLSCLWNQGNASWAELEDPYDQEVGPAKVVVIETQSAMVFEQPVDVAGVPPAIAIAWSNPACLRAVEKNSGECYTAALRDVCSQPFDDAVSDHFRREVDIVCHDAHSANFRAERMMSTLNPKAAKLTMVCDAHKAASIPTNIFDL